MSPHGNGRYTTCGRLARPAVLERWSPFVIGTAAALLLTLVFGAWMMFRPKTANPVSGATSGIANAANKPQAQERVSSASSNSTAQANRSRPPAADRSGTRQVEFPISPSVRMVFCWIPPGESCFGSPAGEKKHINHPEQGSEAEHVFSTAGFWLGKYEVSQGEWVAVMGSSPSHHNGRVQGSLRKLDTSHLPVEDISWVDAQELIKRLNGCRGADDVFATPGRFVIPTEDEWE
jgi:formylglycine-generating enzyme required for sulfatase activity